MNVFLIVQKMNFINMNLGKNVLMNVQIIPQKEKISRKN